MALLYERLNVSGRLKYVMNQARARDFDGAQTAAIHLIGVPNDHDVEAEFSFLTSHLASNVCAMAGEYDDGSQWIVTFERGPGADSTDTHPGFPRGAEGLARTLTRALQLSPHLEVLDEVILTQSDLKFWYHEQAGSKYHPNLGMTNMVRGLAAEACGYELSRVSEFPFSACAFADGEGSDGHECTGDFFNDVFQAWLDGKIQPGDV